MDTVNIGELSVSRLIIGGNPFSGFSHQGSARDMEMRHYYTTERIKQTLSEAQALGINTHISRADHHVMRVLLEFWDEGGAIGRRYRRQDEIGTPWCVTIDFQTLEDGTVTVRDRDTMLQERVTLAQLEEKINEVLFF